MSALKLLTWQGNPATYITMLFRANEFNATIHDGDINKIQVHLKECDAFQKPGNVKNYDLKNF